MSHTKKNREEDRYVKQIRETLAAYKEKHPEASVNAYRQNSASVRVRVIDPDFNGMDRVDRDTLIRTYLVAMPEDVRSEISMLVLVTPKETKTSLANQEFEHPTRSRL